MTVFYLFIYLFILLSVSRSLEIGSRVTVFPTHHQSVEIIRLVADEGDIIMLITTAIHNDDFYRVTLI